MKKQPVLFKSVRQLLQILNIALDRWFNLRAKGEFSVYLQRNFFAKAESFPSLLVSQLKRLSKRVQSQLRIYLYCFQKEKSDFFINLYQVRQCMIRPRKMTEDVCLDSQTIDHIHLIAKLSQFMHKQLIVDFVINSLSQQSHIKLKNQFVSSRVFQVLFLLTLDTQDRLSLERDLFIFLSKQLLLLQPVSRTVHQSPSQLQSIDPIKIQYTTPLPFKQSQDQFQQKKKEKARPFKSIRLLFDQNQSQQITARRGIAKRLNSVTEQYFNIEQSTYRLLNNLQTVNKQDQESVKLMMDELRDSRNRLKRIGVQQNCRIKEETEIVDRYLKNFLQ